MRTISLLLLAASLLLSWGASAAAACSSDDFRAAWRGYAERFVRDGRIVDTGNGNVSHSEGQGYGLILAAAAGDRAGFDRIWAWAQTMLQVRGDRLFAWKWDPKAGGDGIDSNNATDGDVLIAWGLLRGAEVWDETSYRDAALEILEAVRDGAVIAEAGRYWLLPATDGFRNGVTVLNPSYFVFPALRAFAAVDRDGGWEELEESGRVLAETARFGTAALVPDWVALRPDGRLGPDRRHTFEFGFNAIRVPLYLAWAGAKADELDVFSTHFGPAGTSFAPVVPLANGDPAAYPPPQGFLAVADLVRAASGGPMFSRCRVPGDDKDYYSATLSLLAMLAAAEIRR